MAAGSGRPPRFSALKWCATLKAELTRTRGVHTEASAMPAQGVNPGKQTPSRLLHMHHSSTEYPMRPPRSLPSFRALPTQHLIIFPANRELPEEKLLRSSVACQVQQAASGLLQEPSISVPFQSSSNLVRWMPHPSLHQTPSSPLAPPVSQLN